MQTSLWKGHIFLRGNYFSNLNDYHQRIPRRRRRGNCPRRAGSFHVYRTRIQSYRNPRRTAATWTQSTASRRNQSIKEDSETKLEETEITSTQKDHIYDQDFLS